MFDYKYLPSKESVLLAAAIAILISEGLTTDEQNFLGNFLLSIGQNLATIASRNQLAETQKPTSKP